MFAYSRRSSHRVRFARASDAVCEEQTVFALNNVVDEVNRHMAENVRLLCECVEYACEGGLDL